MRLSVPSSSWHSLESLCRSRRNKRRSDSLQATTSVLRGVAGPNQWQTPLQLQQLYVQLVPQQQTCKALQRRCVLQLAALIPMQYLMCCERSRAATTDTAVIEQPVGQQVLLGLASGLIGCDGNYLPFVLLVGASQQYKSITAAFEAASPGDTILIDPGKYNESIVVTKSLKLAAAQQDAGQVEVLLDTQQPYQHCLEIPAGAADAGQPIRVEVEGLVFRHYSKSVANNYCVFAQSGRLLLKSCDISSRSGVGVGVEGAELGIDNSSIHDCERHGVAVFGSLEGGMGSCNISNSSITANKLNGVLVRDGASVTVEGCTVTGNGDYGMQLQDCSANVSKNKVTSNRAGSIALQLESVELDMQLDVRQLEQSNTLDHPVRFL